MTETDFEKLKVNILQQLKDNLSQYLYYHSSKHTERVINSAIHIAEKENVSEQELFLIKIAALFHDTGFLTTYENHEEEGCQIAIEQLKKYQLSQAKMEAICSMIKATKVPQVITNKLDAILADADLDYLGTDDFNSISNLLYKELQHRNPKLNEKDWIKIQIHFFESHYYHTDYAIANLKSKKQEHLEKLKELL